MVTVEVNVPRFVKLRFLGLLGTIALSGPALADTVAVESSNSAAWTRSFGGTGTSVSSGDPAIWSSTFTTTIPAGSTNISFQLDVFEADDKGVLQLNGATIADDTTGVSGGSPAGAGTFDFGLGGGNQAYTFVGFTPGASSPLADGTTSFTLIAFINDTSTTDPNAAPLPEAFISSFSLSGDLFFDPPATETPTPTATATPTSTVTSTPTPTSSPTLDAQPGPVVPEVPTISAAGAALLALILAGMAVLILTRSRG